jgi:hypothetical protein
MQPADHQHFLSQSQRFRYDRVGQNPVNGDGLWITLWMERRVLEKSVHESSEMSVLVLGDYAAV